MILVRILIVCIFYVLLLTPIYAQQPLEASVSKGWSVEEVRKLAFEKVEMNKDLSAFQPDDPFYEENQTAIKSGKKIIEDRLVTYYSDETYSVMYLTDLLFNKMFYYNKQGALIKVEFDDYAISINSFNELMIFLKNKNIYPIKSYQYNYPDGNLLGVSIDPEPYYQYMFYPNGELESYWIGDNGYNPDGSLQMTRGSKPFTEE